jgi:3-oxoacyl-[acyl-carrier protein] reductase
MNILVSGARGELGRIVVQFLADRGCSVVSADRDRVDLTDARACAAFVQEHAASIVGVIHLAGGIRAGDSIAETSDEDVSWMMSLNVGSAFNLLRATIPVLAANGGGSIITIGARAVLQPTGNRAAYAASKAALVSLTMSAAAEGKSLGIRANCIVPDIIRTPSNLTWARGNEADSWVEPEEIAEVIYTLLLPTSGISGSIIPMFETARRR